MTFLAKWSIKDSISIVEGAALMSKYHSRKGYAQYSIYLKISFDIYFGGLLVQAPDARNLDIKKNSDFLIS